MKKHISFFVLIFLFGCKQTPENSEQKWQTIEIHDYLFDFPPDFKLVKEQGIDSDVGKIVGNSMRFGFDFGFYSNSFGHSVQEYLDNGNWKSAAEYQFMKEGVNYNDTNRPKIDVLSIRPATSNDSILGKGCDYVAKCIHEKKEFDFPIWLDESIKKLNFTTDTIDHYYRKIVYAKDPENGPTGIYMHDLNSFDPTINSYKSLSMSTGKLTKEQQDLALKIFQTGRHK